MPPELPVEARQRDITAIQAHRLHRDREKLLRRLPVRSVNFMK